MEMNDDFIKYFRGHRRLLFGLQIHNHRLYFFGYKVDSRVFAEQQTDLDLPIRVKVLFFDAVPGSCAARGPLLLV